MDPQGSINENTHCFGHRPKIRKNAEIFMDPQGSINENAQCAFSVGYRCKIKITEIPIK